MQKGNLAHWMKKEGDAINPGDAIAEIETDKVIMSSFIWRVRWHVVTSVAG
jgi:hypothetical protein